MNKINRLILTLLFVPITIGAQTLEECRTLARQNYPELKRYNLIAETEQFNLSNVAKAWLPQIVVSGQATYQSATPTYPEEFSAMMAVYGINMTGLRKDQYKLAVDISQNLWDGGMSKANQAIIKADAAYQKSQTEVAIYALQSRIDDLYFGILLLDKQVEQTYNLITVLEGNLTRITAYQKNGVALQADVDAVEAELLSAQQKLGQIEACRSNYRRMLEIFIGRQLTDKKLKIPAKQNINNRQSARPEFAMFDSQYQLLDKKRQAIQTSLMPRFSAFAQGYYGYPGMDMFKDMMSRKWTLNAIVGVRMSWSITPFYTKKNDIAKINSAQEQVNLQRDIFQFNSNLQTAQEDGEISRLQGMLDNDKKIVELRKSIRQAAESKLKNGTIDATDLLRKIADENNAIINHATHEIELLQAIYKLKNTLNQ